MKTIVITTILLFSPAVLAGDDCLLSGVFKGHAVKTMEDYLANNSISSPEAARALNELFSSVTHEWRCTEMRAWNGEYLVADWTAIKATEESTGTIEVSFDAEKHQDMSLQVEGPCYKIRFSHLNYHEYFCSEAGDGT